MADASKFGSYVLLERIGDGGMAEIFRATRRGFSGFEKQIALKRILPRYSGNDTFVRMLIHEAKLAANLQHFNIVQVLDLGDVDGQVFLAMEYVRGRDLAAILSRAYRRKERIPVPVSLCVATEFLTGLDYAHRKRSEDGTPLGVIHRDISPQNILISYEGEVKVTDFGIARIISEKSEFKLPGNLHGKFGYMSPEQVRGKEIDQRSDIFSAGVVLWEMLTGRRLFRGNTPEETVDQVVKRLIDPPSVMNSEVPEAVDRICFKALERDRNVRFQTVGAFLGELTRASEALSRRATPRDLSVYMRRHFGQNLERDGQPTRERSFSVTGHSGYGISSPAHRKLLGEVLREENELSTRDLQLALAEQRARGGRLGEILVHLELATETNVARGLARQLDLPFIPDADTELLPAPVDLAERFPREAAERAEALPFDLGADGTAKLLTPEPTSAHTLLEVKVILGATGVEPHVTTRSAFRRLLTRWYEQPDIPVEVEPEAAPVILLADADEEDLAPLAQKLRDEELEVEIVTDGRQARRILEEQTVAGAVFDTALPRIDGLNLLLETKSRYPEASVFITSRRADEEHQARALELGADDVLVKPIAVGPLASKIRRGVRRGGANPTPPTFGGAAVSGDLAAMTLVDLVQSLEVGVKSAEIELQYEDGRRGVVLMDEGRIHRCDPANPNPEEGFFKLIMPGPGRFRVSYRTIDEPANLTAPNTFLLMEAMRRLDESQGEAEALEEQPTHLDAQPSPRAARAPIVLTDDLTLE